jgi:dTDP-4-dehydrorhamnose 3,5-epimerase
MQIQSLAIPDIKLLISHPHRDQRGYLTEVINENKLRSLGLPHRFVQENQSFSRGKHTVRGLHAQLPPFAQTKLVRVLRGQILDVAVDVRPDSISYGHHASTWLSADDMTQVLLPAGFLHGFCTLVDDTIVVYKITEFYAADQEIGTLWNDLDLNIPWPTDAEHAIVSDKDKTLPAFKDFPHIKW